MSVAKKTFWFTLGTSLSRLLGLLREAVLAAVFGAGNLLDAFFVANRIPNMLREMLAEGALGSAFTQRYARLKEEAPERAEVLVFNMISLVVCLVGLLVAAGIFFAPEIVGLLTLAADQRSEQFYSNTIGLTRFLFPFILIMSCTAVITGVLHQKGKFFTSAVSPAALNLGYLIGALFFAGLFQKFLSPEIRSFGVDPGLLGLAFGVMLGGLGQALWQVIPVMKELIPRGKVSLLNEETKAVMLMMLPMILGASAGQLNVLVNTNFATSLEEGAVSWLSLSFRIFQLPVGLFGVAIASVILPSLTKKIANKGTSSSGIGKEFQSAVQLVLWLMAPCMIMIVFAGQDIIAFILGGGKFDENATVMTGKALSAYGVGVIGYGLVKVLTSYFYATNRTKFPMKVSFISIALNFGINFFLVEYFGHVGLAYTVAILFCINALLLAWGARKDGLGFDKTDLKRCLFSVGIACLVTGFCCFWLGQGLPEIFGGSHFRSDLLNLKFAAFLGIFSKSIFVLLGFVASGLYYLRLTPKQAFRVLKQKSYKKSVR